MTRRLYERAAADPEGYWKSHADSLDWIEPFTQVLDWTDAPVAKWFVDGKLNVSANCLDRQVAAGKGDKIAYYWEGEDGDRRAYTYAELLELVQKAANAMTDLGVVRGDRVAIFMPMIIELPVAMLACTRIGAAHSVVFGGFSSQALAERINDSECKLLVTADGGYLRGSIVPLKQLADEALKLTPSITHSLVVRRLGDKLDRELGWEAPRDVWWHDVVDSADATFEPAAMDSEDLLYLLYTSGTTAQPKGIMHTTGGDLTGVGRHVKDGARHAR